MAVVAFPMMLLGVAIGFGASFLVRRWRTTIERMDVFVAILLVLLGFGLGSSWYGDSRFSDNQENC